MWNFQTKYPFKYNKKAISIGVFVAFSAFLGGSLLIQSLKPAEAKGEGAKIVTVFDGGEKSAFKTDARTVREALEKQNILLAKEDNVEPALNEELTDSIYNINIYRAAPYLVVDGNYRIKVMTAAKTSRKVAEAAGLKIFNEDIIYTQTSDNPLEDGATSFLSVKRAKLLTVKLFGKQEIIRTQADTIEQFLKDKKITLGEQDGISRDIKSKIVDGDSFEIWRNGKQTISTEEDVAFPVEKIQDASKETNFREVREKGENGRKTVVYEIEMKNGQEISRKKISEVEIKSAKKQIEVVGTKVRAVAYAGGGNKDTWLAASGIPQEYWGYVDAIVTKESGWNPNATNRSSGACGLAQALPCSKVKGEGGGYNPVTSLQWMNSYVNGRYGGWAGAWSFWQRNRWY